MEDEIKKVMKYLTENMKKKELRPSDVMHLSQAVLNLTHALDVLKKP